ncbi:unnamed protein product [Closterium sp. NIES-53]
MADVATCAAPPIDHTHLHQHAPLPQHYSPQQQGAATESRGGHLTRRLLSLALPLPAAAKRDMPPGDSPRRRWVVEVPLSTALHVTDRESTAALGRCVEDAWTVVQRAVADVARQQATSQVVLVLVAVVPSSAAGISGEGDRGEEGKQGGEREGEEGVEAWVVQRVLRPLVQRATRAKVLAAFHVERAASQGGAGSSRLPHQQQRVQGVCAAARHFDAARVYLPSNLFTASNAVDSAAESPPESAAFQASQAAVLSPREATEPPPSPALIRALLPPQCALIMTASARRQPNGARISAEASSKGADGDGGRREAGLRDGSGGREGLTAVAGPGAIDGDLFPSFSRTTAGADYDAAGSVAVSIGGVASSDGSGGGAGGAAAAGSARAALGEEVGRRGGARGGSVPPGAIARARIQQPTAQGPTMRQGQGQAQGVGREAGGSCVGTAGEMVFAERMRRAQEERGAVMRGDGGDRFGPGEGDGRVAGGNGGSAQWRLQNSAMPLQRRGEGGSHGGGGAARSAGREQPVPGRALADRLSGAGNSRSGPLPAVPPAACGDGGGAGQARRGGEGAGWIRGGTGGEQDREGGVVRQAGGAGLPTGGARSGPMQLLGGAAQGWSQPGKQQLQPQQGVQQRQGKGEREQWQGVLAGVGGGEAWAEAAEVDSQLTQWLLGKAAPAPLPPSPSVPPRSSHSLSAGHGMPSPLSSPPPAYPAYPAYPAFVPASHTMPGQAVAVLAAGTLKRIFQSIPQQQPLQVLVQA